MIHRIPQQLVTRGLTAACPIAMVTRGLHVQRGVVRVTEIRHRFLTNTSVQYVAVVEHPLAARPTMYAPGDQVESFDVGFAT